MIQDQSIQFGRTIPASRVRRPRGRRPGPLLTVCTLVYAAVLSAVTLMNIVGPERWWLGSLNLYVPQVVWAAPFAVILPWYLIRSRTWLWVPLLMAAWVFGPIMGWSWGPARLAPRPQGVPLRVLTYNVKWGARDAEAVLANISDADPDVILMQDAAYSLDIRLTALKKPRWNIVQLAQYIILSRYPISDARAQWLTKSHRHEFLRCVLHVGARSVTLFDVHLLTPRSALDSVKDNGAHGAGDVEENATSRELEALGLAETVRAVKGPLVLTGDLNAPVQSRVCQVLFRSGLRDAHSEAGWGYGYTYGQSTAVHSPFVRIDHILVSPQWTVRNCREGDARGSDHSPVVADLLLPDAQ